MIFLYNYFTKRNFRLKKQKLYIFWELGVQVTPSVTLNNDTPPNIF